MCKSGFAGLLLVGGLIMAGTGVASAQDAMPMRFSALLKIERGAPPVQGEFTPRQLLTQGSFCGACTEHSHCGTSEWRCCRSSCADGKRICLKVASC